MEYIKYKVQLIDNSGNAYLYSISDHASLNKGLKIEPVFDGISTVVVHWRVIDDLGSIWFEGTEDECERYLFR